MLLWDILGHYGMLVGTMRIRGHCGRLGDLQLALGSQGTGGGEQKELNAADIPDTSPPFPSLLRIGCQYVHHY